MIQKTRNLGRPTIVSLTLCSVLASACTDQERRDTGGFASDSEAEILQHVDNHHANHRFILDNKDTASGWITRHVFRLRGEYGLCRFPPNSATFGAPMPYA